MIRILPLKVQLLLTDFIDTGIEISYDDVRQHGVGITSEGPKEDDE